MRWGGLSIDRLARVRRANTPIRFPIGTAVLVTIAIVLTSSLPAAAGGTHAKARPADQSTTTLPFGSAFDMVIDRTTGNVFVSGDTANEVVVLGPDASPLTTIAL